MGLELAKTTVSSLSSSTPSADGAWRTHLFVRSVIRPCQSVDAGRRYGIGAKNPAYGGFSDLVTYPVIFQR